MASTRASPTNVGSQQPAPASTAPTGTSPRAGSAVEGATETAGQQTRKIFVGGLAPTVSDSDFRAYFEKYGAVADAVVMFDRLTQRPRGFGFITFESETSLEGVMADKHGTPPPLNIQATIA